jgi:GGDEF domain-containing protein
MYQEVRRARAFNRPLVLIAIEPESDSLGVVQEKLVQEVQRATMKQYVFAALAKTLSDQLGPYNVIAQDGDKFLVLLPEVSKEDLPRLIAQLRGKIGESIGLGLQIGTASMPEVETFDELVEAAYAEMMSKIQPKTEEAVKTGVASVRGRLTSQ